MFIFRPRKNLSEFITRGNIEALPWHAIKLTTNGDRSIVFVVRFVLFLFNYPVDCN